MHCAGYGMCIFVLHMRPAHEVRLALLREEQGKVLYYIRLERRHSEIRASGEVRASEGVFRQALRCNDPSERNPVQVGIEG